MASKETEKKPEEAEEKKLFFFLMIHSFVKDIDEFKDTDNIQFNERKNDFLL